MPATMLCGIHTRPRGPSMMSRLPSAHSRRAPVMAAAARLPGSVASSWVLSACRRTQVQRRRTRRPRHHLMEPAVGGMLRESGGFSRPSSNMRRTVATWGWEWDEGTGARRDRHHGMRAGGETTTQQRVRRVVFCSTPLPLCTDLPRQQSDPALLQACPPSAAASCPGSADEQHREIRRQVSSVAEVMGTMCAAATPLCNAQPGPLVTPCAPSPHGCVGNCAAAALQHPHCAACGSRCR